MKRDMDLIRRLLLDMEAQPAGSRVTGHALTKEGDDRVVVAEHLHLLLDNGFLEGSKDEAISPRKNPNRIHVRGISWRGHDFLDAVRDDTVWQKTKDKLGSAGGSATIEIITQVATGFVKQMLGLTP